VAGSAASWFFGGGRSGSDALTRGQSNALVGWFDQALRQRLAGGKRALTRLAPGELDDQLLLAQRAAAWTARHSPDTHQLWERRLTLLRSEAERRASPRVA
jgi:hypothetical protein